MTPAPKRGVGRPPRADGLSGEEARRANGLGRLNLRLPSETLRILDEIAESLGMSRGGAIVYLVGLGVEHGHAPRAAKELLERLDNPRPK